MKISIVASGTRGDVQPYIALGRGLKEAGYNVRILTSDDFEGLVTESGLEFCSTGISVEAIVQSDEWRSTIESGNFLAILSKMNAEMKRRAHDLVSSTSLFEGTDLILAGAAVISGTYSIAEKLGIPIIQAFVFPFTPTGEFPSPLVPKLPVGGWVNRLSFHITRQMFWQSTRVADVVTRQELGLSRAPFWGPYRTLAQKRVPMLYGYSRHILPKPGDWDENTHVVGYWFLDPAPDWTPPSGLVDFLKAGPPPVYIGFGSMGSRNPEEAAHLALKALALSGQRGVLASGWGGMRSSDLPDSVYMLSSVPHSWLFPQMAAVVHHGGAGTTAAGLRAGVPSIILPFFGDQPFWGQRIVELGVGPRPIPRKRVTPEKLAQAINQAVTDPMMKQRAANLGDRIRSEDGVGQAVSLIDRYTRK